LRLQTNVSTGRGEPFIVKRDFFKFVKLADHQNNFYNSIEIAKAKQIALENSMDLVCFNRPSDKDLAFCKIIDYGKWKYDNEKKKKKQQKVNKKVTKEVRFSPVIGEHDIEHKVKQAIQFLETGNDVLFSMTLKGRQKVHFKEAEELMDQIVGKCSEVGKEVSRKKAKNAISIRVVADTKKEEGK